jgi:hypothetical protein
MRCTLGQTHPLHGSTSHAMGLRQFRASRPALVIEAERFNSCLSRCLVEPAAGE